MGYDHSKPPSRAKLAAENHALILKLRELEKRSYEALTEAETVLAELAYCLDQEAGYLRVGRDRAGLYWVRWKWTGDSPLSGRYTFASSERLDVAIFEAMANVGQCLAGKRTAHLDGGTRPRKD